MNTTAPSSIDPVGLTLAQYAAAIGKHPQSLRNRYREMLRGTAVEGFTLPEPTRQTIDKIDGTIKFCLPLTGETLATTQSPPLPSTIGDSSLPLIRPVTLETESVIIPMSSYRGTDWFTLCLSSQVGCRMACAFCETARMGLLRNLTAAEIVRQRLVARKLRYAVNPTAAPEPTVTRYFSDGIQNLVFMGMGEPLDNYDNVLQAIRVFTEPAGLNFPHTQITVSTVGRIDGLRKLADLCRAEPLFRNLRIAISLNAAKDSLRDTLMPINKGMPLADLKATLQAYPLPAKGRFLIEYVLIKDVNDSPADAAAVAAFCKSIPCIVNLIPYNPQRYAAYETPTEERIMAFLQFLRGEGLFTKRRVTHGRELMGACGQLGNPEVKRSKKSAATLPVLS